MILCGTVVMERLFCPFHLPLHLILLLGPTSVGLFIRLGNPSAKILYFV